MICGISVVVPVYNGSQTIPTLTARLEPVLASLAEQFELVLVNDCSRDASWSVIQQLAGQYPWVRGLNLMRNYGQHNATLCGVRAARYDIIVTMDDDLQHPPEELPKLIRRLEEGYDVVYGLPKELPHSWWRNGFSILTKRVLANAMGVRTIQDIGAFRALRAHLREAFAQYRSPDVLLDVLLSWGTNRFATVTVTEDARQIGESNYDFRKLARVALIILTGFSTVPLRLASMLGFFFTLFGFAVFLYVLIVYLFWGSKPGFPFLASIIAIFSGVQLFALGIMGEYLARMFDRSMDRPPYTIAQQIPAPAPGPCSPKENE